MPEGLGVARTERHDGFERALVDRLDQFAEPCAQDDNVGRGERERQPLGRRVAALGVRFERVVAQLRDRKPGARMRGDVELDKGRTVARPDLDARKEPKGVMS